MKWEEIYNLAFEYYQKNKNCLIPFKYITDNTYSVPNYKLGRWISIQRGNYQKGLLTKKEIAKLNKIKMIWNVREYLWNQNYLEAQKYYKSHGNLDITNRYQTKNGVNLGAWISVQRRDYKQGILSADKINKLNDIGILWNKNNWEKYYLEAQNYYKLNGNLNIPYSYKTKSGLFLGSWIHYQRSSYLEGVINKDKITKLNAIGMIWDAHDYNWLVCYDLASKYYNYYGDLRVKRDFITKDGINYNQDGITLGVWINSQRYSYKKKRLSQDRIDKLNKINMIWDAFSYNRKGK